MAQKTKDLRQQMIEKINKNQAVKECAVSSVLGSSHAKAVKRVVVLEWVV